MRALSLAIAILVPACAPALGPIAFQPEDPKAPTMSARASVAEYEIDCTTPVSKSPHWEGSRLKLYVDAAQFYNERCFFHGGRFPWSVLGEFTVPVDAHDRWSRYVDAIRDRARAVGCPGVAFVHDGPLVFREDQGPIGALCVGEATPSLMEDPDELPAEGAVCNQTKECAEGMVCEKGVCRR